MSQRTSSTREQVYTRGGGRAKRPGPDGRHRPLGRLAAVALLVAALPARAEERIRVLVSPEPREVVELRLEDYVAGVVAGEMPASFPAEAQKAQAVAARSYALTRKIEAQAAGRAWDIGAGVLSQVFSRREPPAPAREAADGTRGEVLAIGMEPVEAYFHAACGGRTEGGLAALGRDLPYLAAVECGRCGNAPRSSWTVRVDARQLARAAGLSGPATAARVAERTPSGRAARVEVEAGGRRAALAAADLRQRLGFTRLPSLAFEIRSPPRSGDIGRGPLGGEIRSPPRSGDIGRGPLGGEIRSPPRSGEFAFEGRGHGHGAGLCQWGAAGLAREGKGYREILLHYYPGAEVVRMY